jgi:pimeloyl-ACP methyl ester carboxylesterase
VTDDKHVLIDGRRVQYSLYNEASDRRAVFEYGTPGTRWISHQLIAAAASAGFQLLVIDRPGYGQTARRAGRRVVDVVDDVLGVVDTLGWDSFAVWGGSGGAPHALAIAARLATRVTACASVVGLAPYDAAGLDWYAGMSAGNVEEFRAAARGDQAYRPVVERLAADAMASIEAGGLQVVGDYDLPESDRRALAARHAEDGYLQRMRLTYEHGIDGWIDDCIAFTRPWGFELSAIDVPTSVWFGPEDALVSTAHQEYLLSTVAGAQRRLLHGGHVLDDQDLTELYDWLAHPVALPAPQTRATT